MMPDRIGIIGNTHGVKVSSRPKPKKLARMAAVLPPSSRRAMRPDSSCSSSAAVEAAHGASQKAALPVGAGGGDLQGQGLRRIADTHVGAALAGDVEFEGRRAGADGKRDAQIAAVDFHLPEGVVLLGFAGRQHGFAQRDAVGLELEAVAVEVVLVGDLEADFDGFVVERTGGDAEGLIGRQRLAGGVGEAARKGKQRAEDGQQEGADSDHDRQCGGENQSGRSTVSAPTQLR
jgi:hypothetical protein